MLQNILREHSQMLQSMADELEAVATAIDQENVLAQELYTPQPTIAKPITVAEPDGRVDVTYNLQNISGRINIEGLLKDAEVEAKAGKIVCLNFGDRKEFWTKETFDG